MKRSSLPKISKIKTPKFYVRKAMHELDTIWSYNVKVRDGFKCQLCGKKEGLNSHHIISRIHLSIRWDVRNGITLCEHCHLMKVHRDTVKYALILIDLIGKAIYNELERLSNTLINFNVIYFEEKKAELSGKAKQIELPKFPIKQSGGHVW